MPYRIGLWKIRLSGDGSEHQTGEVEVLDY